MSNSRLADIRATCAPREDVLAGEIRDNQFAAQLDRVVRAPHGYEIYADAERFFTLSYPTSGLRLLLRKTFGRLAGSRGDAGEHGVLRAETSFGGGKTHSLVAVWHLARGARPDNVADFVDPQLLPRELVAVAAVVGDALDPVNGLTTGGLTSRTLWGEIGAQIGPKAFEVLAESDRTRTAPGTETLRKAFDGQPVVVMIDEIAQHVRQLADSGDEDVRRSTGQVPVFLKNLYEVAMGDPRVVIIISLASTSDAYSKETADLSTALDDVSLLAEATGAENASVVARSGRVVQPATDAEIAQILKRRLFTTIDAEAAERAAIAYRETYERIAASVSFSGGAETPTAYAEHVQASYPFHPELIRVLDKRLGSIPEFQRARGALKLLAEVIAGIWDDDSHHEILNVGDVDLARPTILDHLTVAIGRDAYGGVGRVDVAGAGSHCASVDASRFAGRATYATRSAQTVFMHSLEHRMGVGAGRAEYILGTLRTYEDPEVFDEALAEAERSCWHLSYDGHRWRFHTEPNINKIVEDAKRNVLNTRVTEETKEMVNSAFTSDASVTAKLFPTTPAAVPDEPRLHLAVLDYDHVSMTSRGLNPHEIHNLRDHSGASGTLRRFRNGIVFVVPDRDAVSDMKDRVRRLLALQDLASDTGRLKTFTEQIRSKATRMLDEARISARISVGRCYRHILYPVKDAASGHLAHRELPAPQKGDSNSISLSVVELLKNESKVRSNPLATDWLRDRAWTTPKATTAREVHEWFWKDPGATLLLDTTILTDAIRNGIRKGDWVYFDSRSERTYDATGATPHVELSDDVELLTLPEASLRGLLGRIPTTSDILAVATAPTTAAAMRQALEQRCGKEPTKGQLTDKLVEAVRQDKLAVTSAPPRADVKALTIKEIRDRSLDGLHVLLRTEAERLGINFPEMRPPSKIIKRRTGATGIVLGQLLDDITDRGSPVVHIRLCVVVEEPRDLDDAELLLAALAQLPKHQLEIEVDLAATLPGLNGTVRIDITGSRSDYQRAHGKVWPLLRTAVKVDGTVTLIADFGSNGTAPDTPDYQQLHNVVCALSPSELTVEGVVA